MDKRFNSTIDYDGYSFEEEDDFDGVADDAYMPEGGYMQEEGYEQADAYDEPEEDEANEKEGQESKTSVSGDENSDWSIDGLDKTYKDKEFKLQKAQKLFRATKMDGSADTASQREAIRYATYFSRKGNDEAKNFVVSLIQNRKADQTDEGVIKMAFNAFTLFFRNYVRVEIEKYYTKQPITTYEKYTRVQEGVQECFTYITEHIDRYNPAKGKLTTFFTGRILRGIAMDYEAKRKGRGSKQTMKVDKAVAHAEQDLAAAGIKPTVRQIAMYTGKNVDVIINSKIRMAAENTMGTIDVPDFNNNGGKKPQSVFIQPEKSALDKEKAKELVEKLNNLPDVEKTVFLMTEGFDLSEGGILETDPKTITEVAAKLGIKPNEARFRYNMAQRRLRGIITGRKQGPDRLLSGRQMTFTREGAEENAIDDIVSVDRPA